MTIVESPTSPVTELDVDTARLGSLQNELIQLLASCAKEHQSIDARYLERVNPLMAEIQAAFDRIHSQADAVRPQIVTKKAPKLAKRQTGAHSWRSVVRTVFGDGLDDDGFIAAIRASEHSRRLSRLFLRRVSHWEIDRNALRSSVNRTAIVTELVPLFGGQLAVEDTEEYQCKVAGGFTMSTARNLWPTLEGAPLPEAWSVILSPVQ